MSSNETIILLIQIIATWTMLGIFWFLQLVHYPIMNKIKDGFVQYERGNLKRTAALIPPIMVIDIVTNVMALIYATKGLYITLISAALVLNILTWLTTFLFQMQAHQKLSIQYSKQALARLCGTNWVRTILWTGKSGIYFALLYYLCS